MSDDQIEHDAFDRDDDLRALLRTGDPARALPSADPAALAVLLADVAATSSDDAPNEVGTARRRGRRPLTWLVGAAAAAVVVTAGVGAVHRATTDDGSGTAGRPTARTTGPSTGPSKVSTGVPAVSSLRVSAAAFEARCAVPNAEMLASTDTAFAGTVTAIDGNQVTIARSATYRGSVADSVTVRAPAGDVGKLIASVHFEVGKSYLVSASGGQLALCGFSGPAKRDLQDIYTEAFPH